MQAYGRKKGHSHVAGHQNCGICHPVQKNKVDRGRKENDKVIKQETTPETPKEAITRWEIEGMASPDCGGCKEYYEAVEKGKMPYSIFAPSHKASSRCQSGKRAHCTCDTCF